MGNGLNELKYQFSGNKISRPTIRTTTATRDRARPHDPELFPENDADRIPSSTSPGSGAGRSDPGLQHRVPQPHGQRQLHADTRGNHTFKGGLHDGVRAEERERQQRDPGPLRVRRRRRPHGIPELPDRQPRRPVRHDLHLCRSPRSTSPTISASTATRCSRRTRGASRSNVTLDYGVRYALYPAVTDKNNMLIDVRPDAVQPRPGADLCQRRRHAARRRHRRSAQRPDRRRAELAVRPRHLRDRQEQHPAAASACRGIRRATA